MQPTLGIRYTDSVTGASGVATANAQYLHGADQTLIEGLRADGSPFAAWIESSRLATA
jgi:hypothetical protein